MFKDFFLNMSIIIIFMLIAGQLIFLFPHLQGKGTSLRVIQILAGIFLGTLGVILMFFSIQVNDQVFLDLRHIPAMIAAAYFGIPSALLSAFIISLSRILFFDGGTVSIVAALSMLLIGIACAVISKQKLSGHLKFFLMNISSTVMISMTLYITITVITNTHILLLKVLLFHVSFSFLSAYIAFYTAIYLLRSHQTFAELKTVTAQYQSVIQSVKEIIFHTDIDGKWTFLNRSWEEITGYSVNESLGKSFLLHIHPDDFIKVKGLFYSLVRKETPFYHHEMRIMTKNGEYKWIEVFARFNLDDKGRIIGTLGTINDVTERKNAEEQLKKANEILQALSLNDGLTSIPNRRYYNEVLKQEWEQSKINETPLSLLMVDIDYFKLYNDAYGHHKGDVCLKEVALTLQSSLNSLKGFVARYGGEEFSIILPNTDIQEAWSIGETLLFAVQSLHIPHEQSPGERYITLSIGAASMVPSNQCHFHEIIERADQALYGAKRAGRNQVHRYDYERFYKSK